MDLITTGHSTSERKKLEHQMNAIRDILDDTRGAIKVSELVKKFNESSDVVRGRVQTVFLDIAM